MSGMWTAEASLRISELKQLMGDKRRDEMRLNAIVIEAGEIARHTHRGMITLEDVTAAERNIP